MQIARACLFISLFAALAAGCGTDDKPSQLKVLDVTPDSSVEALDSKIVVRFDRPAVPAEQVGKPVASSPVTLSPSVGLTAHWSDRQTLVLTPSAPLAASTRYALVFGGALKTQLGAAAEEQEHTFVAGPVRITAVRGMDTEAAPPEPTFSLAFSVPVKPADVAAKCTIARPLANEAWPLKTSDPDAPSTQVALSVTERLTQGVQYELRCSGITGVGGNAPMPDGFTGLHHVAIAYPTRVALADGYRRLKAMDWPVRQAESYPTHDALYIVDPDGNTLELMWDKPAENWPRTPEGHQAVVFGEELDLDGLLAELG